VGYKVERKGTSPMIGPQKNESGSCQSLIKAYGGRGVNKKKNGMDMPSNVERKGRYKYEGVSAEKDSGTQRSIKRKREVSPHYPV